MSSEATDLAAKPAVSRVLRNQARPLLQTQSVKLQD